MAAKKQKYYKVLTKDLKAPINSEFSYENWQTKTFRANGSLEMCRNGLHLYTSLKSISIGSFGERVFEAKPTGEYIPNKDKICCREIKLIKELKPEEVEDFRWAYNYCRYVKDIPEVYKHITESWWAYKYCHDVEDRQEVYKNITNSEWAYHYCYDVEDRPEVYKNIINSEWAYYYCRNVKDRPEVYKHITDSQSAYYYCYYVKDRAEVYKHITDSGWAYRYCRAVKYRPEVYKHIAVFKWTYWNCFLNWLISTITK